MPFPGAAGRRLLTSDQTAPGRPGERHGEGYVWGGTGARPGDWDCSSYVSYVLGHDLRLALPGGKWGAPGFPPNSHGPVVTDYAEWKGAVTVSAPARGDLVCFVGEGPSATSASSSTLTAWCPRSTPQTEPKRPRSTGMGRPVPRSCSGVSSVQLRGRRLPPWAGRPPGSRARRPRLWPCSWWPSWAV